MRKACHSALLVLLLGCAGPAGELGELPEPFTHATAMRDCAPWDAAAVTVLLTTAPLDTLIMPTPPYLQLTIWRDPGTLENAVYVWPSDEQIGAGFYCVSDGECEPAVTGMVQFRDIGEDSSLVGEFELTFQNEEPFSGGFRAPWLLRTMMCG